MSLQWIALAMMAAGASGVGVAYALDRKSSFKSRSFLIEIILGLCGGAVFAAGAILMLIALFVAD